MNPVFPWLPVFHESHLSLNLALSWVPCYPQLRSHGYSVITSPALSLLSCYYDSCLMVTPALSRFPFYHESRLVMSPVLSWVLSYHKSCVIMNFTLLWVSLCEKCRLPWVPPSRDSRFVMTVILSWILFHRDSCVIVIPVLSWLLPLDESRIVKSPALLQFPCYHESRRIMCPVSLRIPFIVNPALWLTLPYHHFRCIINRHDWSWDIQRRGNFNDNEHSSRNESEKYLHGLLPKR